MQFVVSDGRRIHYEVSGAGPDLFLHHGFTSRSQAWRFFGFTEVLQQHYRVIALDALGHGLSDKPRETTAYTLQQRTADVLAILDELQIEKVNYCGYSLGGWVGYGMVRHARHRLQSLVLGAAHPYADTSWDAFKGLDGDDATAFIQAFESVLNERISAEVKMMIRANDLQALAAAARHGAVRRCTALLARATFVSLPGVTHFGGLMQSKLVLPPLLDFLAAQATP